MEKDLLKIADNIMMSAQLASALEVSGTPKPGNVHRDFDFIDTRFEHYLAGSIALGPSVREVALRGMRASLDQIRIDEIEIGRYIKKAIHEVRLWHKGGNTHLGISLLFVPLAASAGFTTIKFERVEPNKLRQILSKIMRLTTPQDAMDVCDVVLTSSIEALGRLEVEDAPDIIESDVKSKLIEKDINLYELMKISSGWDNIAKELTTGMRLSFNVGYKTLIDIYKKIGDINIATVHTFLTILAKYPDTLVARKVGVKHVKKINKAVEIGLVEAKKISRQAKNVLKLGGLTSKAGGKALIRLDKNLRDSQNRLNPGTTADITASSLMIAILCGMRP
ncbi:MAG: triphosphoribosyl-dephospho-CoA synthase [Candidatus Methylarchaceae archaeon HK01M]|nr:triphosphoribosyl-dephospho-CoA synthase [Candidatus Methylarchaceae archaeon HK01M]